MDPDRRVTIQVRSEPEDFFRVLWRMRRWTLFVTLFLICLVLGSFSFYASMAAPAPDSTDTRWVVYATSLLVPIMIATVVFVSLKAAATKAAGSAELVTMTFDEEGVEIAGPKTNSKSVWNAYEKVVVTSDDFIFYVQSNIFYGVPKRFFDTPDQIEIVQGFITENFRK